jgi:hydroxyacylglutathione hydrolase
MCRKPHASLAIFAGKMKLANPTGLLEDGRCGGSGHLDFPGHPYPRPYPGRHLPGKGGAVFTGDTLFAGSIGRTDLPGGSYRQIIASIKEKDPPLPPETLVYPGHGPASTVGEEQETNPFLR